MRAMGARFATDYNLGKPAKRLRILGYDTLYERGNANRSFLMEVGEQGRIALTHSLDRRP
jgi:uncharacterized protein with PIN domain